MAPDRDKRLALPAAASRPVPTRIIPSWIKLLGLPVWVTDITGTIVHLNKRAEKLFGHSVGEWVGLPCYQRIGGRTREGVVCARNCTVRLRAAEGLEITPVRMRLRAAREVGEVCIIVIPTGSGPSQLFVHCVVDDERERRTRLFLEGVIQRGAEAPPEVPHPMATLTPREREILAMLATDLTLHDVAERLSVSYVTVRNHVAHILTKLGVHSILEAVALWVMDEKLE